MLHIPTASQKPEPVEVPCLAALPDVLGAVQTCLQGRYVDIVLQCAHDRFVLTAATHCNMLYAFVTC